MKTRTTQLIRAFKRYNDNPYGRHANAATLRSKRKRENRRGVRRELIQHLGQ